MADTLTILAIDDSEDDRFLYRRALKASDRVTYRVIEKDNGEDGVDCLDAAQPDCVLLDYSLPGHNGIEILKQLRTCHPFLPVLMLTGQGNESVAVSAILEGAQHYLAKNAVTPETLQRSIDMAINYCTLQKRIYEQRTSLELFTRALAHDLKEPVRTIRSFLDLIATQNLPPEKMRLYFSYIHKAAERMGGLIDTVYFYLRLDSADAVIGREPCDSGRVLQDALENLAALIKERNATITADTLPEISANRVQLTQLFQNLIGNAIHHGPEHPVIHVSAQPCAEGWQFRVVDNGPGIAAADAEKIFQPFKRLSHQHKDGLGLGLAICKKIVDAHGGAIDYETAAPHGACFRFTLRAPERAATPPEGPSAPVQDTPARQMHVLIVDDNDADIELIRFALMNGQNPVYRLDIAHDGREALDQIAGKQAAHEAFDLVLLDINMPGMDGFDCLSHMRGDESWRGLPVVMCSTSAYDKDMDQAKKLGANGYLIKPFDLVKLQQVIGGFANSTVPAPARFG